MLPIIARQLFKIHEHLLGRSSFEILAQLLESEYWDRERQEQLQLQRLQHIVYTAYEHAPFWRELMDCQGLQPQTIQSLDDLQRFPLLDKEIIRAQRERMVWKGEGKRVQMVRTSGSTNEALEFYTSSTREAHINAARMRGHEWVGMRRGEKELYYWGSPVELSKQDRIKHLRDWLINDGLTNGFEVTPARLESYVAQWLKWRPKCIFGYPSTFVLTVTMAESLGIDLRELKSRGLAMIITTSELLSDPDR
ncbi:MAG: phenylacetate--CoA ligase family protein, partial [Desulfuromonadaceae bacterium]